jgi:hypothetical protein
MNKHAQRIRRPVGNQHAPGYVLLMLLAFGVTVVGTRLFLEVTGYPQIGNATFHIAHALWGGLLLAVGALLTLVYINRWVFTIAAILAGAGVGLFIDEIGKFITRDLDYFFPLAAPIIYVSFLITVFVYLRIRHSRDAGPRAEMYAVLEDIQEILDDDLNISERDAMIRRLEAIRTQAERADLAALAESLLGFARSDAVRVVPDHFGPAGRAIRWLTDFEDRRLPRSTMRRLLVLALVVMGFTAAAQIAVLGSLILDPGVREALAETLVSAATVTGNVSLVSYAIMLALDATTGLLLLIGLVQFVRGREESGIQLGALALIISLTGTNVFSFYFRQFSVAVLAFVQLTILLALLRYRGRFLQG